jgi:beta-lactamase regulating signal transducer with metallopeptidase domain
MSATLLQIVPVVSLTLLLKASVILLVAAASQLALRRRASAAMRHGLWTLAIAALLALPLLSASLPALAVAVPAWSTEPAPTTALVEPVPSVANQHVTIDVRDGRRPSQTNVVTSPIERSVWPGWSAVAFGLYVAGLLGLLSRLVVDQVAAQRLAAAAHEIHDSEWKRLLDECRALMGLQTPVRLLRTRAHVTPMAIGIGAPAIVIPETADAWTMERRRAVLLHELAHIERRDCLTQTLASLATALYWIHPGAWWAARRLQVEREYACDDRVLGLGAGARDYAGHLLDIAYSLGNSRTPALAVGMARRGQLEGRLLAVLDAARNRRIPGVPGRLIVSIATLAVLLPFAALTASTHVAAAVLPEADEPVRTASASEPAAHPAPVAVAPQTPAQDATPTSGAWEIQPSERAGRVHLQLRQRHSSDGREVQLSSLEGLSASAAGQVTFTLKRDAGTFTFEGTVRNGAGAGAYTFTPSAAFADALQKRGIGRPTAGQQHEMAKSDVSLALLDDLTAQGYQKPTIDDLVRAGQHGVDPDFVHGMGQLGYHVGTVAALINMRDHGVSPDYVQGLMAQGIPKLSAEELVRARDHGVDPAYVKAMREAGYGSVGIDGLVNARDHGVDPEYVKAMSAFGYSKLPLDNLVNARDHGISADYIKGMADLGFTSLPLDALINARDHGVTADFARSMRDLGQRLELKELVRARDHGVTPDYVKELKTLGYDQLSIDDLVTLRDHGVTPDKVRRANARAGSKLPPDMLRSLADGGSL